jgi:hypothetical protein
MIDNILMRIEQHYYSTLLSDGNLFATPLANPENGLQDHILASSTVAELHPPIPHQICGCKCIFLKGHLIHESAANVQQIELKSLREPLIYHRRVVQRMEVGLSVLFLFGCGKVMLVHREGGTVFDFTLNVDLLCFPSNIIEHTSNGEIVISSHLGNRGLGYLDPRDEISNVCSTLLKHVLSTSPLCRID